MIPLRSEEYYIILNLALWLKVSPDRVRKCLDREEINKLRGLLDLEVVSFPEGLARKALYSFIHHLPEDGRYLVTDTIKRLRHLIRKELMEIPHCEFVKTYLDLRKKLKVKPLTWNKGKRAVVCLTHDVDSARCYDFIADIVEIEKKFNLRSTFNFLTNWGYKIEPSLLKELKKEGFEIGLHGYTHDLALGRRSKKKIRYVLKKAIEELDFPVKGFRAPAFAITRRLLEVLEELGIRYDSSLKVVSVYGQGVQTPYPYLYPGLNIWEVPLTIQDDRLFRDQHLSCEEGFGIVKELTKRIANVGGVTVINTHPRILKEKFRFYQDLLEWLSCRKDFLVCPTGEVVDFMEKRYAKIQRK